MKRNKKIWSFALAGALAVSNLSVVAAPFSGIVAQANVPTWEENGWTVTDYNDDISGAQAYTGTPIQAKWVGAVLDKEQYYALYKKSGSDSYALVQTKKGDTQDFSLDDKITEAKNTTAMTLEYAVFSSDKEFTSKTIPTGNPVSTISIEIIDSSVKSIEVEEANGVTYIPDVLTKEVATTGAEASGAGWEGLDLTATTSYGFMTGYTPKDDQTGFGGMQYKITSGTTDVSTDFAVEPGQTEETDTEKLETTNTFKVEAGATAKKGDYTFTVWADTNADGKLSTDEKSVDYSFTVVNDETNTSFVIKDDAGTAAVDSLDVGKTRQINLYKANKKANSNVEWTVDANHKNYVSVSSTGLITAVKAIATPSKISASYTLNKDMGFSVTAPYIVTEVTETGEEEKDYSVVVTDEKGKKYPTEITLAEGKTATAKMLYGEEDFEGPVEWSSDKIKVATVDENTGIITAQAVNANNMSATITGTATVTETDEEGKTTTKTVKRSFTVNVPQTTYVYSADREEVDGTLPLRQGKSANITVAKSNGDAISGTIKWESSNTKVATVTDKGVVTVLDNAAEGSTSVIIATVNGVELGEGIEVEATVYKKTPYVVIDGFAAGDADYNNEFYQGDSKKLAVKYLDEDDNVVEIPDVTWTMADNQLFSLSGNTVKMTAASPANDTTVNVTASYTEKGIGTITLGAVPIVAKSIEIAVTYEGEPVTADSGSGYKYIVKTAGQNVINMEVGETRTIKVMEGNKDITNQLDWQSTDSTIASVYNGVITGEAEGLSVKITGDRIVEGVTTKLVEVDLDAVLGETGALALAENAISDSNNSIESSGDAVKAAENATKLALATINNPSEENFAKAQAALDEANANLDAAKAAYATAKENYEAAVKAGAKSAEAKEKVDLAEEALTLAQKRVEAAEEKVASAAETVAEAEDSLSDIRKEAAIDAANAVADAAVANPTDATIKAAQDAVEAAKAAGATDADLKAATDKIATAEAAKKAADEEAAKKSDGSAAGTPAPVGNELKDAAGATTGFVVTNATAGSAEVEFKGSEASKAAKSFTVPDTVKDSSGNEYKVTSIAANAFAGMDAKTVTIGKNITKIDKNAFANSNVKKVNVKGTKLTKASKKAFNKLKKGSTIKVTGKNKKANKKLLNTLKNVKNGKIKVK